MEQPTGGRTGGIYIPPFKLALLRDQQGEQNQRDAASLENQKLTWEALRKSLNGLINKVNVSNIKNIIPELFQENLIRGRGLFARAIMKAQLASPGFTQIYAALIAVINTKLPENGELILKRVIYSFKRAYKRRDKITATALAKFIAHLVNHQVAHELLALQLLTVLLEEPTDDSVEIAVAFVKEVGQLLQELSPQGLHAIFERFRGILHEGDIDKRVQYTIEGLFAIWKSDFKDFPAIPKELDLVEREDQITFEIGLDDEIDREEMLDVFRFDKSYSENEKLWEQIKKEILGEEDDDEVIEDSNLDTYDDLEPLKNEDEGLMVAVNNEKTNVIDLTEQDLINLRRSIYLTIMSSVSFEECCHKLVKLNIPDGYEHELCNMLVECCANERSYLRYYGLMGQRFCMMHIKYQNSFDDVFLTQYNTIHRLETNKLRNVSKFFAHLLGTDALPWTCFEYIKLNERDTTSSSRIFIKVLVQDLAEILGLSTLRERFSDPYMQDIFSGMFPRDNARDIRFSINFFTSIGLGGLTDGLREHLKNMPKILAAQMQAQLTSQQQLQKSEIEEESDSSSSSSSSSSSTSDSDSESDSDSDGSSSSSSSSSDSESESSSSSSQSSSTSSSVSTDTRVSSPTLVKSLERSRQRSSSDSPVVKKEGILETRRRSETGYGSSSRHLPTKQIEETNWSKGERRRSPHEIEERSSHHERRDSSADRQEIKEKSQWNYVDGRRYRSRSRRRSGERSKEYDNKESGRRRKRSESRERGSFSDRYRMKSRSYEDRHETKDEFGRDRAGSKRSRRERSGSR